MQRLLIANRSEIARRIARSARERGLETVGVFAPEDAALAREYGTSQLAALPGAGPSAYLDVDALVRVASEQGCDALHPGYGFASERPALARACEAAGLRFVGPSADTLERFGDKASARTLAQRLGVPVLDGSSQPVDLDALREFRARLPEGTSLVLKAVAGGGGRGMRIVAPGEDLAAALARCRSEVHRAFGVEAVIAERHRGGAPRRGPGRRRSRWTIVVLGDRECSLQRRHQKLIERAPRDRCLDTPGHAPRCRWVIAREAARRSSVRSSSCRRARRRLPRGESPSAGRAHDHGGGHGGRPRRAAAGPRRRTLAR
ncbi:MAG: biotin carboxylase N-terminal domain-containing protein [Myxococcota bacterium]